MSAPFSFLLPLPPRPLLVKSKISEHPAALPTSLYCKPGQGALALRSSTNKVQKACPQIATILHLLQMWGFAPSEHLNTILLGETPHWSPPIPPRKSGKPSLAKRITNNLVLKVAWLPSEEQASIAASPSSWLLLVLSPFEEEGGKVGVQVPPQAEVRAPPAGTHVGASVVQQQCQPMAMVCCAQFPPSTASWVCKACWCPQEALEELCLGWLPSPAQERPPGTHT